MKTMLVAKEEMKRANPHLRLASKDYFAKVESEAEAKALADRLRVSYFDLDGVFYGRMANRWNVVH